MAETLSTLSIISFILSGVALALAIVLWFFFDIPTVIGDLTGRTARKTIAKMRAENEKSGVKKYKEGKVNLQRGKLTETMSGIKEKTDNEEKRPDTGLLAENRAETTGIEDTVFLNEEASRPLAFEETSLLVDENETVALDGNAQTVKRVGGKMLTLIEEVMLIHTDEVIKC